MDDLGYKLYKLIEEGYSVYFIPINFLGIVYPKIVIKKGNSLISNVVEHKDIIDETKLTYDDVLNIHLDHMKLDLDKGGVEKNK